MRWSDVRAVAAIVRREHQLFCRGPVFWAVAGLASLLALWRASPQGTTAALAAYQTWRLVVVGIGALAVLLAGAAAARDRRRGLSELVLAKPAGSTAELVIVRFIGTWLSLLGLAAIMLAASSIGQTVMGGTPWRPSAYANALLRSVLPIGLASAFGFSLATLFTTPLASAAAAIYWVATPLARPHLPAALDPTPSQHWPLSALVAATLVVLTASLHARPVRGKQRRGAWTGWVAAALFGASVLAALTIVSRGDDALTEPAPVLAAIATQAAVDDRRAPGFWLPDAEGRLVALTDFAERPIILAFWGPAAPSSVRALALLDLLAREFEPQRLACIAVCVDRDAATVRPFAREVGEGVVMLWDRGCHFGDGLEWSDSPLAVSYDVSDVPTFFLLDRERRLVDRLLVDPTVDQLRPAVSRLVAEG